MIIAKGKEIAAIIARGRVIAEVRKGSRLVWSAVRSCFGSGVWRGDKPWRGDERWK